MNDNAIPTPMCDIVLKGGLTSGVVYPLALARLAKDFRFSNIGAPPPARSPRPPLRLPNTDAGPAEGAVLPGSSKSRRRSGPI
jgi:hypothetical protein